jgi:nicotinic acid mononucleotide adenylyltransferase
MGSDLLPTLHEWDDGDKLISEINFIVFDRRGYEYFHDQDYAKQQGYLLPKNF